MANVGLYAYQGSAVYYVLDDNPQTHVLAGKTVEQDITPSFTQSTEGQAGSTETQPTAEVVWRDQSGSMGLYKQSSAPGDLTRCFVSDADTTRSNQITAWLQWPGGATVTVDLAPGGLAINSFSTIVDDPTAIGFVAGNGGGAAYGYWRWNGTKFALQRAVNSYGSTPTLTTRMGTAPYTNGAWPYSVVTPTGTNLWTPMAGTGCSDVSVAAAVPVGISGAIYQFVYFDILFVIAASGGDLTVTPYRPRTPGGGNILQSVTYTGLANALGTITGEQTVLGVAPCEGAVYIVTDRSVYAMQWNDNNNTMLFTKLFSLPRITSGPCVWNGEVYIGAENRIAHITPGQRGFDWRTIDGFGVLPPPFSSTILSLTCSPDALFAQIATWPTNQAWCIMRMDTNGAWSCPFIDTANAPGTPIFAVQDGTNPFGIGFLTSSGGVLTGTATILPMPTTGRNPRSLAVAQRAQRPGPFRTIGPWYNLTSETAQKLMERIRETVLDVTAALPIKVYYQTDYLDEASADTFTTGAAKGTGLWHICAQMVPSMVAGTHDFAGTTDSGGRGTAWYEFDNSTNYTTVGLLPVYPTNRQVRFLREVNGDNTGTKVPTDLSLGYHRLEFVTKGYERTIHIRIRVGEDQGVALSPASTVTYATSAAAVTAKNAVRALVGAKTIVSFVDENNVLNPAVITKYELNLLAVSSDGTPNEYAIQLTLQYVQLAGLN